MKNDQALAARKAHNPYRETIKLSVSMSEDGTEIWTPYLIADPEVRGPSVTVSAAKSPTEITRLFAASIRTLL